MNRRVLKPERSMPRCSLCADGAGTVYAGLLEVPWLFGLFFISAAADGGGGDVSCSVLLLLGYSRADRVFIRATLL